MNKNNTGMAALRTGLQAADNKHFGP